MTSVDNQAQMENRLREVGLDVKMLDGWIAEDRKELVGLKGQLAETQETIDEEIQRVTKLGTIILGVIDLLNTMDHRLNALERREHESSNDGPHN